ncbi:MULTISPECIES: VanZ family protein [Streptomyces]|uniref:VanZ family protein n=1 Tax=Streptomyces fuscus TaxID=3048495 RepID=A0ABT7J3D8_9ACTN|nr:MULTISPECIES: VanZ family protein [Streptomyces]MCM1973362.1 VanZ family protein [Streptomyces sp. G1]MDL2079372.1 VanZ family protein [Streptomyces fuscus]
MLEAVFQDRIGFLIGAVLLSFAGGCAAFSLAHRKNKNPWWYGLWVASIVLSLGVTVALTDGAGPTLQCTVNKDLAEPFYTTQGRLNLAMYLPIGFFGTLALRRPLTISLVGAALTTITELAQATVPWVSRTCDTSDLEMNALGGLLGALAGWAVIRFGPGDRMVGSWKTQAKHAGLLAVGCVVVLGVALKSVITPHVVDATSIRIASSKEEAGARAAMTKAFGDHYRINKVQLMPGFDGGSSSVVIAFDQGNAELSWPDAQRFSVMLEDTSKPGPHSFPVDGVTAAPKDKDAAYRIAETYARQHYPWALKAVHRETEPVGEDAEFGWVTSWRWAADGVLMPRSLDVQINRVGRVSQLVMNSGPAKADVPKVKITDEQAEKKVRDGFEVQEGTTTSVVTLKAVRRDGQWRAEWMVSVSVDGSEPYAMFVDAETGTVFDYSAS